MSLIKLALLALLPSCRCRRSHEALVRPRVIAASHSIPGYGPDQATDGNDETFWLVPGGQRMEAMS